MLFEDDATWGWGSDDLILGSVGNDALFGGAGADELDGAIGADLLIGGAGNDEFKIDRDCEVDPDDVVDGGPGTDVVYSHMTSTELATAGVMLVSIESYVLIDEAQISTWGDCGPFCYDFSPRLPEMLTLSWQEISTENTIHTSTTGVIKLDVENESESSQSFVVRYTLLVGSVPFTIEESPSTLSARGNTTFTLDLSDFIPGGLDPEAFDLNALMLSGPATLVASADVLVDSVAVESALAPTLYGHAHDPETLKIYRKGGMDSTYCGGDLAGCRAGLTTPWYSGRRTAAWGAPP
jgi:hypothetical protein